MERVIDYLTLLGHSDIGFIGHHGALGPILERRNAVLEYARSLNPRANIRQALDADSLQGGKRAAAELISTGAPPTAIVCVNDIMAVGALLELRERGLRVPGDISVTGFDNIELAEFCYPALTTVHVPRDLIGHTIFRSLVPEGKSHEVVGREFTIMPELMVRDSTGPARRTPPPL